MTRINASLSGQARPAEAPDQSDLKSFRQAYAKARPRLASEDRLPGRKGQPNAQEGRVWSFEEQSEQKRGGQQQQGDDPSPHDDARAAIAHEHRQFAEPQRQREQPSKRRKYHHLNGTNGGEHCSIQQVDPHQL